MELVALVMVTPEKVRAEFRNVEENMIVVPVEERVVPLSTIAMPMLDTKPPNSRQLLPLVILTELCSVIVTGDPTPTAPPARTNALPPAESNPPLSSKPTFVIAAAK